MKDNDQLAKEILEEFYNRRALGDENPGLLKEITLKHKARQKEQAELEKIAVRKYPKYPKNPKNGSES